MKNMIKDIIINDGDATISTRLGLDELHTFIFGGDVLVSHHCNSDIALILPDYRIRGVTTRTLWILSKPFDPTRYGKDYRKLTEDEKIVLWDFCVARLL